MEPYYILPMPLIAFVIIVLCVYLCQWIKHRNIRTYHTTPIGMIRSTDSTDATAQQQSQTVNNNLTSLPEALPSGYLSQNYSSNANYGSAFDNFQSPTVPPPGYSPPGY